VSLYFNIFTVNQQCDSKCAVTALLVCAAKFGEQCLATSTWCIPPRGANHFHTDSVLDCLNTSSPESLKVVLHGFELFGGVPLPIRDLARD
jgi:hypothetical protein